MDLTDFLLARIAEDEADARKVQAHAADAFGGDPVAWVVVGMDDATGVDYNPARVLAECDAKRRIVEDHSPDPMLTYTPICRRCAEHDGTGHAEFIDEFPCPTLRLLALPYPDHPDYDPEWKA